MLARCCLVHNILSVQQCVDPLNCILTPRVWVATLRACRNAPFILNGLRVELGSRLAVGVLRFTCHMFTTVSAQTRMRDNEDLCRY